MKICYNNGMIDELLARLQAAYPHDFARIRKGLTGKRTVSLRVNPLKTTIDDVRAAFAQHGIRCETRSFYADALVLPDVREDAVKALPVYERGEIYLQNLSSMLPPLALAPAAGENILDMTAAPGGKTTQLYALSQGKALITACERDTGRFERLRYNLAKQGATRVNALKTDAAALDDFLSFDKIMLDAPCTGSGTVENGNIRFSQAYLEKCVRMQRRLLQKAFTMLKRNGLLVYSTCSVLPEEDEEAVRFAQQLGAVPVPVPSFADVPRLPSPDGTLCVCPDGAYEGFFLAAFTKRS